MDINNGDENSSTNTYSRSKWSKSDKLHLLEALKKYGHTDIRRISEMVPRKAPSSIKSMINKLVAKSREVNKNKKSVINEWLQSDLLDPTECMIPQALFFIHLFEKYPPSGNDNCDYSSIYYFLYTLSLGRIPPELSPATKMVFYEVLSEVMDEVWPRCQEELLEYIGKVYKAQKIHKVYTRKKKLVSSIGDVR